ncbi:MAG: hypothetical protein IPK07_25840 [Deltaproteobacteria bacterium]|nr:hypothetical protein [Deltaproteobacteria bacterium]
MRPHQFLAAAFAEYEDAAVYYELQEPGLGSRFLLEVDEAIAFTLESPPREHSSMARLASLASAVRR